MQSVFLKIDVFGKTPPAYNINGHHTINSVAGGVVTLLVLMLTLSYATTKFNDLVERKDVTTNVHFEEDGIPLTSTINVNNIGFRMAFTVENFLDRKTLNDPRYVRWILRMYCRDNSEYYETILPYDVCTVEELNSWGDHSQDEEQFEARVVNGVMYCLDESVWDGMLLGGHFSQEEYYRLELIFSPCNYIHSHLGTE